MILDDSISSKVLKTPKFLHFLQTLQYFDHLRFTELYATTTFNQNQQLVIVEAHTDIHGQHPATVSNG